VHKVLALSLHGVSKMSIQPWGAGPHPGEGVGSDFDAARLLVARERSVQATQRIAGLLRSGMREDEANRIAEHVFRDLGFERIWHPTHIRFGPNTLRLYKESSDPEVVLGENDLFFIDIGPVWDGHEGDYGDTFVLGHDPEHHAIAVTARELFDVVADQWRKGCSGRELYAFAERAAEQRGYELNLGAPGHRLGDFPHAVHRACKLAAAEFVPAPGLWVLEIQIRHPTLPIGAFFEDLLLA
jgi:Xaa-Pro aminopeptidase